MMSTARDYYEILGLSKGASIEDIKKSYRQLVMKHHPDRVPSEQKKAAEEKFKEISEAYAVLSDPQKKELYDKYGHAGIDSRYTTEDIFRGADFSSIFKDMGGFGSIFEDLFSDSGFDIFGGRRTSGRRQGSVGEDIELQVVIDLEEAATGLDKDISYFLHENCDHCRGSGAEPGSPKVKCSTCKGAGAVRSGLGFISFSQTCPACGGAGETVKNRCRSCYGEGRIKSRKNLKVTIPKGVDTGSILRLRDEGHFGRDGRGDLYIHIKVKSHSRFERRGDDIRCKVKISVLGAILGTELAVPTLNGKVNMKIPPGTQPNTIFRLKDKGVANLRTKRPGDEFVEVEIEIPKRLSFREKRLLDEWKKLRKE